MENGFGVVLLVVVLLVVVLLVVVLLVVRLVVLLVVFLVVVAVVVVVVMSPTNDCIRPGDHSSVMDSLSSGLAFPPVINKPGIIIN